VPITCATCWYSWKMPAGTVTPTDAEGLEVDDVFGQLLSRRGLAEGPGPAVPVVEGLVLA